MTTAQKSGIATAMVAVIMTFLLAATTVWQYSDRIDEPGEILSKTVGIATTFSAILIAAVSLLVSLAFSNSLSATGVNRVKRLVPIVASIAVLSVIVGTISYSYEIAASASPSPEWALEAFPWIILMNSFMWLTAVTVSVGSAYVLVAKV